MGQKTVFMLAVGVFVGALVGVSTVDSYALSSQDGKGLQSFAAEEFIPEALVAAGAEEFVPETLVVAEAEEFVPGAYMVAGNDLQVRGPVETGAIPVGGLRGILDERVRQRLKAHGG